MADGPAHPRTAAAPPVASHLRGPWLWRMFAAGQLILFVARLTYVACHDVADGYAGHFGARVFDETTGALLAAPLLAGLLWLARRWPLVRPLRPGTAAVYAAAFAAITSVHTTAMIAVRAALAPAFGLHGYPRALAPARYAYEAVNDLFPVATIVALLALGESVLAGRARERRAAALERGLLRAELSNLRLQLQPHFLFNALNTISATMYEDVSAADAQLAQLADLLRASLRTTHAHEVPARDELALLGHYLGLLRARFGDRLEATVMAPPEVDDLLVPSMVLQPLVENAVRHGGLSRTGRGRVAVTLARDDGRGDVHAGACGAASAGRPSGATLTIRVRDDVPDHVPDPGREGGAGEDGDRGRGGTGLSATARRLQLLYGDAQSMQAGPVVGGGFAVVLLIPARVASAAGAPSGTPAVAAPDRPWQAGARVGA